jgi:hypothetical protein
MPQISLSPVDTHRLYISVTTISVVAGASRSMRLCPRCHRRDVFLTTFGP